MARSRSPLFRVLARQWKSLAPVKLRTLRALVDVIRRRQTQGAARLGSPKPRQVYAHQKIEPPKRSWNPWLWVK
jgi:hypothetical protein